MPGYMTTPRKDKPKKLSWPVAHILPCVLNNMQLCPGICDHLAWSKKQYIYVSNRGITISSSTFSFNQKLAHYTIWKSGRQDGYKYLNAKLKTIYVCFHWNASNLRHCFIHFRGKWYQPQQCSSLEFWQGIVQHRTVHASLPFYHYLFHHGTWVTLNDLL